MERLTQHTPNGASLILDNPSNAEEARQQVTAKFMLACNRLAAYEDTGLTPDEVVALDHDVAIADQLVVQRDLARRREDLMMAEAENIKAGLRQMSDRESLPRNLVLDLINNILTAADLDLIDKDLAAQDAKEA